MYINSDIIKANNIYSHVLGKGESLPRIVRKFQV